MRSTRLVSISATTGWSGIGGDDLHAELLGQRVAAAMLVLMLDRMSIGSALSSAIPASYRLISSRSAEQRLEPVELVDQQFGGPGQVRREVLPPGMQHVGGHPDRGQRRPQLVGDVGGEPALQLAELLQLADLHPDRLGHPVERTGQRGQLDRAGHRHPLGEVAGRQLAGAGRGPAHRPHHLGRHQCRDQRQRHHQRDPADQQRALHHLHGAELAAPAGRSGTPRRNRCWSGPARPSPAPGCSARPG